MRRHTIAFAVLLSAWLYAGVAGIDFGHHWDEGRITGSVAASLRSGVMLPGWYNYPSFCYQLGLAAAVPEVLGSVFDAASTSEMSEAVAATAGFIEGHSYLLRLRVLFLLISALTALWIFLLVIRWRGGFEAVLAAGFFLASWEFAYHARWVAPDALLAMAVALGMLLMYPLLDDRRGRHVLFSAAAAGLAAGIKYQGGILLLPLFLLLVWRNPQESEGIRGRTILQAGVVFACIFLFTTPGALIDPFRFVGDVVVELRHYSTGHWGHNIAPGFEHAAAMTRWLVLDTPAPWPMVSLLIAGAVSVGVVSLFREQRRAGIWYLILPLTYFLYMSFQQVMIVRNLLLLLPFMAVLAARGFVWASEWVSWRPFRIVVQVLPFLLILVSLAWQIDAGERLRHRHDRDVNAETRSWIDRQGSQTVVFSPALARRFPSEEPSRSSSPSGDTLLLFTTAEIDSLMLLPANHPIYTSVSTLPDVNVTVYPDWSGEEKVLGMTLHQARRHRVFHSLLTP
ncbi:MAG: glycosyltransferase family 39 protein [Bacteroidetes bacterium]|nr:glycosyltransferase family 39 protein [Bacteroidota bacterium]